MNNRTLATLLAGAALSVTAACGGDANNSNANRGGANTNRANANAVVTTPTPSPTPARPNGNMTRADYDREKARYDDEARRSGRTIGTGINDSWLWTKVRAQLATADDLRDSTINVDVANDVVTLTGTVANGNQKIRAADIATKTEGVKSVKNNLTIASGNTNAAPHTVETPRAAHARRASGRAAAVERRAARPSASGARRGHLRPPEALRKT